jgi:hypothetical protein
MDYMMQAKYEFFSVMKIIQAFVELLHLYHYGLVYGVREQG